jgi:BirA family biotin operon repressor/biotin-[acetyl-CoA-carboxylase] ligase
LSATEIFSATTLRTLLQQRGLRYGEPLSVVNETTSTNDDALTALKAGAPAGALFLAERQSQGRGRHGRQWFSAPGQSLTFSLLLRPRVGPNALSALTLVIGLAVRDALANQIDQIGQKLQIKWPNDIVHGRQKLAGILLEKPQQGPHDTAVVAGIGVNVGSGSIPSDLSHAATAVALLTPQVPSLESLLASILGCIETRVTQFETQGLPALVAEIREHDALLGQSIFVDDHEGVACGISDNGELLLQHGSRILNINAGTVLFAD